MRAARQSPAPTGFAAGLSTTSEASAPSTATEISDAVAGLDSGAMRFVGATGVSADGIALGGAVDRSAGSTDARRGTRNSDVFGEFVGAARVAGAISSESGAASGGNGARTSGSGALMSDSVESGRVIVRGASTTVS